MTEIPDYFRADAYEDETPAPRTGLKIRRATDLKLPPPTKWLGRGWLPRREITVLVGAEGIGKSLLWVLMAMLVTTGRAFPMFNWAARQPADVVVIVTEDSASEVEARLRTSGADISRIHFFCAEDDGTGTPVFSGGNNGDMLLLSGLLDQMETKPAFLVVDAWLDTVAGNLNIRDTQQARSALHPWKELATRHDLAVLLVTHTNRMDTTNTRDLMGGTAALRQKARMVLFAARPPAKDDSGQFLWVGPDKANTTGIVDAVKFQVRVEQVRDQTDDDPGTTALLAAPASALMPIAQLLSQWKQEETEAERKPSKAEEAEDAIKAYMEHTDGTALASEVKDHLRQAGYGKTASESAMKALGTSAPSGPKQPWVYTLREFQTSYPVGLSQEVSNSRKSRKLEADEDAFNVPSLPELPKSLETPQPSRKSEWGGEAA
ncbi:AAA family ATPase [Arthrobacter sp. LAR12-1-1.1]|uniref:AAA family ATPase n=1 Tax=Arthrobacter sp. LAR12-1-1.1 TaxID=3135215 RepID=UPI0034449188